MLTSLFQSTDGHAAAQTGLKEDSESSVKAAVEECATAHRPCV